MTRLTDFGFQKISILEKTSRVQEIFRQVAPYYNLMNDLTSLGIHRLWKQELVQGIKLTPHMTLLDVAGGTGDIAYQFLKTLKKTNLPGSVIVCDLNKDMLQKGQETFIDHGILEGVKWIEGNAEALLFESESVDVYAISFGLRNISFKDQALKEAHRVLKKGGQFLCLEFSEVKNPILKELYNFYSFSILPKIGKHIAKNQEAYQYLVESIRQFPNQETLVTMLQEAGFCYVSYRNLSRGIVAIHQGWKS